jgi:hypothetical protein
MSIEIHAAGDDQIGWVTPERLARLSILGAVLWFCAVLYIRFVGPFGTFEGVKAVILYASMIPVSLLSTRLSRRVVGFPAKSLTLVVVGVPSAAALFMDGIAFVFFRDIYGTDPAVILGGAAWLLWTIGVTLAIGLVMSNDASQRT